MKIGIMTFWWSQDNYGQLLQCYALQKYLRDLGHDAFLIRYDSDEELKKISNKNLWKKIYKAFNPVLLYEFLYKRIIKNKKIQAEYKNYSRNFDEFRKKYIVQSEEHYKSYKELKQKPPKADMYIVGSDQVWNFMKFGNINNDIHKAYFLDFGSENVKRISYAASWGRTDLSKKEIKKVTPLLKNFNTVSVREKSGIKLCKQCGNNKAKWVCDPTILLKAQNYRELYKAECVQKKNNKYLLCYMLSNTCDFNKQNVYDFAKLKNLEVAYVTGNGVLDNHNKTYATIPQWLSLVDNAEYVITNSFHCCVFSILFNKKVGVIPLTKNAKEMNSRFDSLFEMFGMEQRFIKDDFDGVEKEYRVKESDFINNSKSFLNEALTPTLETE